MPGANPLIDSLKGVTPTAMPRWFRPGVASRLLGVQGRIPFAWAWPCAERIRHARNALRDYWEGLNQPETGPLTDWLLAGVIARENVLLLGPPGTAKTEMATRLFELFDLRPPRVSKDLDALLKESLANSADPRQLWRKRQARERKTQKYFYYLLSRFTQPEELFGPIEIALLRQGLLVRVNFGLLTGAGVRAVFIDEVFKASSAILNTLLTVTNEHKHFNWGGMEKTDVLTFIAAANEVPGGLQSGVAGVGAGGEDFQTLYAFLDRFPIRLNVPAASGTSVPDPEQSDLARAFEKAFAREAARFVTGSPFGNGRPAGMPCINDALLLGRFCYQYRTLDGADCPFDPEQLTRFRRAFLRVAGQLQGEGTSAAQRRVSWTISPRKLKALYKIALAHALVRDGFPNTTARVTLMPEDLKVFDLIWDTPVQRSALETEVKNVVERLEL